MKNLLHWDTLGFLASMLCALHCAATPFILAFSALGGLAFLADPSWEASILGISAVVAVISLLPSYKKHQQAMPLWVALSGFFCIGFGHLSEDWISWGEPVFAALGGFLVAMAHLKNWDVLRRGTKQQACEC
jgi:hypothetical protein